MRTLSHEKTSSRKNLNDSAGTRHNFSHKMFASQQCSYIAVFPQERFLGRKFPYEIFLSKRFQRKFSSEGRILAEKLAGRSIVAEQFVSYSQEKMFSENDRKISRKGSLAAKFPARIPCTKIQIHSFHDNLVFEADMRLKEIGLERIR